MPEETKPVERELALKKWHDLDIYVSLDESFYAGWEAALERAAQLVETRGAARRDMYDLIGDEHAAEIRALKGRE